MEKNFKVGDKIKFIKDGKEYDSYQEWADKYKMKNFHNYTRYEKRTDYANQVYHPLSRMRSIAKVIAVGKHIEDDIMLAGIEYEDGFQTIVSFDGLLLIESCTNHTTNPVDNDPNAGKVYNPYTKTWSWF
jgi:methylphosphotriester-DNA--protein-cysteine methyltransferase